MPALIVLIAVALAVGLALWLWNRSLRIRYVYPAVVRTLYRRGRLPEATRLAERALALPVPGNEAARFDLRYFLAFLYMSQKRYEDAAQQCRLLLDTPLPAFLQAKARRRLADCLEGMGQKEAAQVERAEVIARIDAAPESDLDTRLERARVLAREQRHGEAADLFATILTEAPPAARPPIQVEQALALWNAGRYPESLAASESALASGRLNPALNGLAHSTAGLALANLGRWDDAVPHREEILRLARQSGNPERIAQALAQRADLEMQRGALNEAMVLINEALPLSLPGRRQVCLTQAEILKAWGRYDDALEVMESAARAPGAAIPHHEERSQGILALGRAQLHNDRGDRAAALEWLARADAVLEGDPKLRWWTLAERARTGDPDAAVALDTWLESGSPDTTTRKVILRRLAEAAEQDDPARALSLWERYRDAAPMPIALPRTWYGIAEALARLGRADEARAAYERAVAFDFGDIWSTRARAALVQI